MGSRSFVYLVAIFLLLSIWSTPLARAQAPAAQQPDAGQVGQQGEPIPKDVADRMAKERLKTRYHDIKRDSERLLEMATELKQYVDKSGEDVMSLQVIRKCEEIEKLSKSVRTKMKGE